MCNRINSLPLPEKNKCISVNYSYDDKISGDVHHGFHECRITPETRAAKQYPNVDVIQLDMAAKGFLLHLHDHAERKKNRLRGIYCNLI